MNSKRGIETMNKLTTLAVMAFGLSLAAHADVLLWQVNDPEIVSWGGQTFKYTDSVLGPDYKYYTLNAARVAAVDANGEKSYLMIGDTKTGVFDENVTGVLLNEAPPATLPIWAGLLPEGDAVGWSIAIELGALDEQGNWTSVAATEYAALAELKKFIAANVADMPGMVPWSPTTFNAPEPSGGLLAFFGAALLALRRRRVTGCVKEGRIVALTAAGVLTAGGLFAAPVVSSNIHGLVRIDPTTTNTIVSVPWVGYTADGKPTQALPANRLVSPIGLTHGDLLMQVTNEVAYAAWSLDVNATTGARSWQPVMSASRSDDAFGRTRNEIMNHTGTGVAERGRGIWVIRQNPLNAGGTANPIYLYGQWTNAGRVVEIPGVVLGKTQTYGGYDACTYTMLANPDCTQAMPINDLGWDSELVGASDTIVIPNDSAASRVLFWEEPSAAAPDGRWYYTKTERVGFAMKTTKGYDATVPAGVGFWYVRRAADPLYVIWPGATMQKQTMDVEISEGEEK